MTPLRTPQLCRTLGRTVAVLCMVAVCVALLGCGKNTSPSASITTGPTAGAKPTVLQHRVGETVTLGDVTILVPVWAPIAVPARPMYPLSSGSATTLGEGQKYYQGVVRIVNKGQGTVWVDPRDFSAVIGKKTGTLDPSRSGPVARVLLHGTSLELILTFIVPEGSEPALVYHPRWLNGTLSFTGEAKPLGVK